MKGCDVVIFKNGKVAVPRLRCYICSCMNLRDGSPRLNDQEAPLSAAAAVTRRRWTCILTTDERGSASSTISSLERHVRCGGLHAVVRVEAANGRRSYDQATSGAERRQPHAPCAGSERDWPFFAKAATAASVSDTQHLA